MNDERLQYIYNKQGQAVLPVKPGMRLELHEKVGDGNTQRIWKFKGLVLSVKKPNHPDGTFTIRGESARMTIEKIYPLSFPNFDKVMLLDEHKVRRSKLYYMRNKIGKAAKLKSIIESDRKNIDLLDLAVVPSSDEVVAEKETPKTETKVEEVKEDRVEEKTTAEVETKEKTPAVETEKVATEVNQVATKDTKDDKESA